MPDTKLRRRQLSTGDGIAVAALLVFAMAWVIIMNTLVHFEIDEDGSAGLVDGVFACAIAYFMFAPIYYALKWAGNIVKREEA